MLDIKYEQHKIYSDTLLLLRYNYSNKSYNIICREWLDLHRYVRSIHYKVLYNLYIRNKKVFIHEHELFTQQDLKKHEKFRDDHPGAVDQISISIQTLVVLVLCNTGCGVFASLSIC